MNSAQRSKTFKESHSDVFILNVLSMVLRCLLLSKPSLLPLEDGTLVVQESLSVKDWRPKLSSVRPVRLVPYIDMRYATQLVRLDANILWQAQRWKNRYKCSIIVCWIWMAKEMQYTARLQNLIPGKTCAYAKAPSPRSKCTCCCVSHGGNHIRRHLEAAVISAVICDTNWWIKFS